MAVLKVIVDFSMLIGAKIKIQDNTAITIKRKLLVRDNLFRTFSV
jgi:hypothetical protein